MICPKCGDSNDDALKFCSRCGYRIQSYFQNPAAGTDAPANPMEAYFKAVIGPKKQEYYLRRFSNFASRGSAGLSWHWPSCFITLFWLLYRKMWLAAFLYWLLPFAVIITAGVIAGLLGLAGFFIVFLYLIYLAAIFIIPPLFANALYYRHCKKKIVEVQASGNDMQWQLGALTGSGGTSNAAAIVAVVVILIAFIGILAAIAIPQFITFKNRAIMAQASAAGKDASQYVAQFYLQQQRIPATMQEAGMTTPLPAAVNDIVVDGQNGTIIVTMKGSSFTGKALLFIPSNVTEQGITWTCIGQNIEDRYLPSSCRSGGNGN